LGKLGDIYTANHFFCNEITFIVIIIITITLRPRCCHLEEKAEGLLSIPHQYVRAHTIMIWIP
jgi:hypothetical protein